MVPDQDPEPDLVERARNGDVAAFEALVRLHQAVAVRTAWIASGGGDDAEDAAQDGFMKAFQALAGFRPGAPFRPWLLTIVANEARNRRRSAGRRDALALRAPVPGVATDVATPESAALQREQRQALLDALGQLPAQDREVLAYRYLVGLSESETAALLRVALGTVKSRRSRALERLRTVLGPREVIR